MKCFVNCNDNMNYNHMWDQIEQKPLQSHILAMEIQTWWTPLHTSFSSPVPPPPRLLFHTITSIIIWIIKVEDYGNDSGRRWMAWKRIGGKDSEISLGFNRSRSTVLGSHITRTGIVLIGNNTTAVSQWPPPHTRVRTRTHLLCIGLGWCHLFLPPAYYIIVMVTDRDVQYSSRGHTNNFLVYHTFFLCGRLSLSWN